MSRYQKELDLAVNPVKDAIKITKWFKLNGFRSFLKQDKSPVITADMASQIFIVSHIKKNSFN